MRRGDREKKQTKNKQTTVGKRRRIERIRNEGKYAPSLENAMRVRPLPKANCGWFS